MRENTNQSNSEYGLFSRSENWSNVTSLNCAILEISKKYYFTLSWPIIVLIQGEKIFVFKIYF